MEKKIYQTEKVRVNTASNIHLKYAEEISQLMAESAAARRTGIAKRSPQYIEQKMIEGKAVIATSADSRFAGFCYIETWNHGRYVANSGLIVTSEFRGMGLGKMIKKAAFELSRKKFPEAKIFGITTSPAVLKINTQLGYKPVSFTELTDDEEFWKGCQSCSNFDILTRTERKYCLCTGMLFDPEEKQANKVSDESVVTHYKAQLGNDIF
jgi:hypothetical protein